MRAGGVTVIVVLLVGMTMRSWAAESTFELVLAGKSCKEGLTQGIDCEYKVGKGLHFSINGIGMPDTGITFMKSSFDGDFYATYGLSHGCVVVKRGPEGTTSSAISGPESMTDYAFVSPRSGKVYTTWEKCKAGF